MKNYPLFINSLFIYEKVPFGPKSVNYVTGYAYNITAVELVASTFMTVLLGIGFL